MSMLVPHLSGLARFKSLKYKIRRSLFFGRYTRPVLLDITMHTYNKQTHHLLNCIPNFVASHMWKDISQV